MENLLHAAGNANDIHFYIAQKKLELRATSVGIYRL